MMRRYLRNVLLAALGLPLYNEVEVLRGLKEIAREVIPVEVVDRALNDVDRGFDAGAVDEYLHEHIERVRARMHTLFDDPILTVVRWRQTYFD